MRGMGFKLAVAIAFACMATAGRAQSPDFNREVRPLLSQHCFKCHGPDEGQRKAGLRLDRRDGAKSVFALNKAGESGFVKRIVSHGGDIMPPAYANKPLSAKEIAVLRRWIAAGAVYKPHWAFVPPRQAALPTVQNAAWCRNPIDKFILARLERQGLKPSPEADRITLVRRVYLDLIGLPPTPEEADAFLNDRAQNAYERLVDRLLASPRYGERWARRWLDLARYADTNGYEKDRFRSVWPYRDWVINALNRDMPFDQFTIQQLAGDLLPNAGVEERIATGFHRNTMLNEEGGIDPLEFRYYAVVDRVATTGTAWLGLTVGCAQCHTHKFDPITQREYYKVMAFLDNADELTIDVPRADLTAKRREIETQIADRTAHLAEHFPVPGSLRWAAAAPPTVQTTSGAQATILPDNSVKLSGLDPDTDTYTVRFDSDMAEVGAVRLETLTDPSLGNGGPGRTPHGNFVLTEFTAMVTPRNGADKAIPVKFVRAEADFAQDQFPPQNAIDGDAKTGWAISGTGKWNVPRTALFYPEKPIALPGGGHWTFRLEQAYGGHHTLGRFRISLGQKVLADSRPIEVQREEELARKYGGWLKEAESHAVRWNVLRPTAATSNLPRLTLQDDASVFVSGDMTKHDIYTVQLRTDGKPITALRLEALPDDRLPGQGPGRVFYEGGPGDFFLSEIALSAGGGKPLKWASATQSGIGSAAAAIDGNPQTGWSINGRQGQASTAIFRLAEPLKADTISVQLDFEQYYAAALGRFRIAVTSDSRSAEADLPPDVEEILLLPTAQRTSSQQARLRSHYLSIAPELEPERGAIAQLRRQMPAYPTALAFLERPADYPRPTYIHHRGEFLQREEPVTPGVPAILPGLPASGPANRLTFARWLVSPQNPLTARVAVNRQWAALFGAGLVRSVQDFGYQGESPSHPELLDWLAVAFETPPSAAERSTKLAATTVRASTAISDQGSNSAYAGGMGWSLKRLHRLIVTSATYRQSSRITPELLAKDPENRLLARGPRLRLEAELLRDATLTASGLLSPKIGGPSVFPPQPPGVTSEGTYGALDWKVSEGEDRYRRGLYTFSKRTAPYAMFTTFDAPTGEVCVARREVSDTPLQALAMLNDQVFLDASQALGRMMAARSGTTAERVAYLFRRCVTRPPTADETSLLVQYFTAQEARFEKKELNAATVAGMGEGDANARAAWTVLARSLLNLDEAITRR
jgi:mono/diheme cytochrome c family protein